jgi:hypothetical protein
MKCGAHDVVPPALSGGREAARRPSRGRRQRVGRFQVQSRAHVAEEPAMSGLGICSYTRHKVSENL